MSKTGPTEHRTLPSTGVRFYLDIYGPVAVIDGVSYRWDRKKTVWKKDKEQEKEQEKTC